MISIFTLFVSFIVIGFNTEPVEAGSSKAFKWFQPVAKLEIPISPLKDENQFPTVLQGYGSSVNKPDGGQFMIQLGLKTSEGNDDYFSNNCRCMRRHFCSNENRIRQERAVNVPACHDGEVMCCMLPSPTCGVVEKFPLFRPFPTYGEASYGEYPWTVLILDGKDDIIYGTGIIINPSFVLTTARNIHQFTNTRSMRVRLGEWDLASDVELFPPMEIPVKEAIVHQAFSSKTFQNDIAVLRLNSSIDLSGVPSIRSACLARPGEDLTFVNARCFSAGWGSKPDTRIVTGKNVMKKVDLKLLDAPVCERAIRRGVGNPDYHWDDLSFVCAGGDQGKGLCRGDEGAALICRTNSPGSRYTVVGMSSWGTTCGEAGFPGVFTNIATYYKWIKSIDDKI